MKRSPIKNAISIILSVVGVSMLVFFIVSCVSCVNLLNNEVVINSDGYFQYIIMGENSRVPNNRNKAVIAIVGFTSLGLEQETIDIPREIDGKTVRRIGFDDDVHKKKYYIYSENLRKIYIHDNIKYIENFEGEEVSMMLCSMNDDLKITLYAHFKSIYLYDSMLDKTTITETLSPANIVFMNNYSEEVNEGYYRLDNIESNENVPVPPSPVRSGYEFTGWFTESECINAWDFDVSPTIEEDTVFRLYAGWRAL